MKHSAELKERELILLLNTPLCEELRLLEIYSYRVGSELKRFAQKWIDAIQKNFSGERFLLQEND